jgi:hypothetical protein
MNGLLSGLSVKLTSDAYVMKHGFVIQGQTIFVANSGDCLTNWCIIKYESHDLDEGYQSADDRRAQTKHFRSETES